MRRGRLLVDAALREDVVQVGALVAVVDDLELLLLATGEDRFGSTGVQMRRTVRLSVVAPLHFAI